MKTRTLLSALAGAAVLLAPVLAEAQKSFDLGKSEYETRCAVCHGLSGKGDGAYLKFMNLHELKAKGTGDLTLLAKRNGGVFPLKQVYEYIDGTAEVLAHGPRDMPIWGLSYRRLGREEFRDADYERGPFDPAVYARTRILALADYLNRLQAK